MCVRRMKRAWAVRDFKRDGVCFILSVEAVDSELGCHVVCCVDVVVLDALCHRVCPCRLFVM